MSSPRPFKPLEKITVTEQVRDEIFVRITSGELQPGTQLPAERVLATEFGVARTSVREAIHALIAVGMIERRDKRSFVTERLPDTEIQSTRGRMKNIRDLLAARRIFERLLFELAISRATTRERQAVFDLASRGVPGSIDELMLVDRQFHALIAGACANPVLVEVYGRVVEALALENLSPKILLGLSDVDDEWETIARVVSEHMSIANAFLLVDIEAFVEAVEHHIGLFESWVTHSSSSSLRVLQLENGAGLDRVIGM